MELIDPSLLGDYALEGTEDGNVNLYVETDRPWPNELMFVDQLDYGVSVRDLLQIVEKHRNNKEDPNA